MKLVTGILRKLGVEKKNLHRERDFVGYALTGAMSAAEKFQILNPVVVTDAVDVMDGFFGKKFAADGLFHDVTMFKNVSAFCPIATGYNHSNVAVPSYSLGDLLVGIVRLVADAAKGRPAFSAAQPLLAIYGASGFALNRHRFSALDAVNLPLFVGQSLGQPHADSGTESRILPVFLEVGADISRLHEKRLAALFAGKFHWRDLSRRTTMRGFMRGLANSAAESLGSVTRFYLERGTALFTRLMDGHLAVSFGFRSNDYAMSGRLFQ